MLPINKQRQTRQADRVLNSDDDEEESEDYELTSQEEEDVSELSEDTEMRMIERLLFDITN